MVGNCPNLTFQSLVDGLIEEKKMCVNSLAEAVGCDRATIRRNRDGTNKKKAIIVSMGIALGLNLSEMYYFLYYAGITLCPAIPVDKCYISAIETTKGFGLSRVKRCNEILFDNGFISSQGKE